MGGMALITEYYINTGKKQYTLIVYDGDLTIPRGWVFMKEDDPVGGCEYVDAKENGFKVTEVKANQSAK